MLQRTAAFRMLVSDCWGLTGNLVETDDGVARGEVHGSSPGDAWRRTAEHRLGASHRMNSYDTDVLAYLTDPNRVWARETVREEYPKTAELECFVKPGLPGFIDVLTGVTWAEIGACDTQLLHVLLRRTLHIPPDVCVITP